MLNFNISILLLLLFFILSHPQSHSTIYNMIVQIETKFQIIKHTFVTKYNLRQNCDMLK